MRIIEITDNGLNDLQQREFWIEMLCGHMDFLYLPGNFNYPVMVRKLAWKNALEIATHNKCIHCRKRVTNESQIHTR